MPHYMDELHCYATMERFQHWTVEHIVGAYARRSEQHHHYLTQWTMDQALEAEQALRITALADPVEAKKLEDYYDMCELEHIDRQMELYAY